MTVTCNGLIDTAQMKKGTIFMLLSAAKACWGGGEERHKKSEDKPVAAKAGSSTQFCPGKDILRTSVEP